MAIAFVTASEVYSTHVGSRHSSMAIPIGTPITLAKTRRPDHLWLEGTMYIGIGTLVLVVILLVILF